jgi:hypothetical protein
VSALGVARFGAATSVLDFLHLGSSLSLRSFARLGSCLSVAGTLLAGGTVSIRDQLRFAASSTYIEAAVISGGSGIQAVVGGNRALSMSSSGGFLHGSWIADATVSTSDRRLKSDITPLADALSAGAPAEVQNDATTWALRELRPVSYRYKSGPESKYTRYGFIADEIARVLPNVIRPLTSDPEGPVGIVLPDLIALLVEQSQSHQATLERLSSRVEAIEATLASRLAALEEAVAEIRRGARIAAG